MSNEAVTGKPYRMHAIQLVNLRVSDLAIHADLSISQDEKDGEFSMECAHSDYDSESKQIQVKVVIRIGDESGTDGERKVPFTLEVAIHGIFEVDESRFDIQYIEDWATKNAPLVLYPYAREQVYSLTTRAGFKESLLPLLEIPTFKVVAPTSNIIASKD